MSNFYCKYCGSKFASISALTGSWCSRHPDGSNKGHHAPFEGRETSQYFCEHCGSKFPSISALTGGWCSRHPDGSNKGRHCVLESA